MTRIAGKVSDRTEEGDARERGRRPNLDDQLSHKGLGQNRTVIRSVAKNKNISRDSKRRVQ